MLRTVNSPHAFPLECLIGRKLDFNVDLRVAFGDYCQVHCADMDNSLDQRTSGAIALLLPQPPWFCYFFDLNTLRVIKRLVRDLVFLYANMGSSTTYVELKNGVR
jgi:hypothetical protein